MSQSNQRIFTTDENVSCGNCGKVWKKGTLSFKRCSRCKVFWYCSKECQTQQWRMKEEGEQSDGGHKVQCDFLIGKIDYKMAMERKMTGISESDFSIEGSSITKESMINNVNSYLGYPCDCFNDWDWHWYFAKRIRTCGRLGCMKSTYKNSVDYADVTPHPCSAVKGKKHTGNSFAFCSSGCFQSFHEKKPKGKFWKNRPAEHTPFATLQNTVATFPGLFEQNMTYYATVYDLSQKKKLQKNEMMMFLALKFDKLIPRIIPERGGPVPISALKFSKEMGLADNLLALLLLLLSASHSGTSSPSPSSSSSLNLQQMQSYILGYIEKVRYADYKPDSVDAKKLIGMFSPETVFIQRPI